MGVAFKSVVRTIRRPVLRALRSVVDHRLADFRMPPDIGGDLLLTFDDGPHPEYTPRLMDMLDAAGARAIFFVIGERAVRHPALLRDCLDRGHVIGNHTFTHLNDGIGGHYTTERVIDEITRCAELVAAETGFRTTLFRPPRGEMNLKTLRAVRATGHSMMLWSVEGGEWGIRSDWAAQDIGDYILRTVRRRDIFLMHDDNEKTLHVLPRLIRTAQERGYELASAVARMAA